MDSASTFAGVSSLSVSSIARSDFVGGWWLELVAGEDELATEGFGVNPDADMAPAARSGRPYG